MTRDFNNQRRDGFRSPSHGAPSRGTGKQRSSGTARPRLNRETIDNAWENGANRIHADYHPRTTQNGQASRTGWKDHQRNDATSHGGQQASYRAGYGNNQGRYQRNTTARDERHTNDNNGERPYKNRAPRAQSFGEQRYAAEDRPWNRRNNAADRPERSVHHQGPRPDNRQGQPSRNQDFKPRRGAGRNAQPEPHFNRNYDRRSSDNRDSSFSNESRRESNPRWMSRPDVYQRGQQTDRPDTGGKFEGDYEHFSDDSEEWSATRTRGARQHRRSAKNTPEPHVTPMPDGRVIKGSRPAQRRTAQFWSAINDDVDSLVEHVQSDPVADKTATENDTFRETSPKKTTSKANRSPKGTGAKPRTRGPKPSQKGFTWPDQ